MTLFFHLSHSHCTKKHLSLYAPLPPRTDQFSTSLTSRFISVSTEVANPEECAPLLRRIASTPSLPPQYWLTLQCLLRHFARVCQNGSKNLLSARALGEIFSPVFFRQQTTRWVSLRAAGSRLTAAYPVKDRHPGSRQTDKCAGSVMQHGGTPTLRHAQLQTHTQRHCTRI